MRRTQRIPCRCFGSSSQPLGYTHVARNLGLLAVATLGAVGGLSWTAPPELAGALVAIVTGGVVAVLVITLDEIAALFRPVRS
jgi:hypothetical protein